jgi:hypothetical protein
MGDWVETDWGFTNLDQVLWMQIEPELPLPDAYDLRGRPKAVPAADHGRNYKLVAAMSDGNARDLYSELSWWDAWELRRHFRESIRTRQESGGSGWIGLIDVFSVGSS